MFDKKDTSFDENFYYRDMCINDTDDIYNTYRTTLLHDLIFFCLLFSLLYMYIYIYIYIYIYTIIYLQKVCVSIVQCSILRSSMQYVLRQEKTEITLSSGFCLGSDVVNHFVQQQCSFMGIVLLMLLTNVFLYTDHASRKREEKKETCKKQFTQQNWQQLLQCL